MCVAHAVEPSFTPALFAPGAVKDVAVGSDGSIYVAGNDLFADEVSVGSLVKLNADGSLNAKIPYGTDWPLTTNSDQKPDRLQINGNGEVFEIGYVRVSGMYSYDSLRFWSPSGVRTAQLAGSGNSGASMGGYELLADGRVVLLFGAQWGIYFQNGSRDATFPIQQVSEGVNSYQRSYARFFPMLNGRIGNWIYGKLPTIVGPDGTLDSFDVSQTFHALDGDSTYYNSIVDMAAQADGKILVAGHFNLANDDPANMTSRPAGLARFNGDGTLDASFAPLEIHTPLLSFQSYASRMLVMPAGTIVLSGSFEGADAGVSGLRLLNGINGAQLSTQIRDTGLAPAIAPRADGSILIGRKGPMYSQTSGEWQPALEARNLDGSAVPSFKANIKTRAVPKAVVTRAGGGVVVAGPFSTVDGKPFGKLRALDASGRLDEKFVADFPPDAEITMLLKVEGDRILVGGNFEKVNGQACKNLALLESDGTVVRVFTSPAIPTSGVLLADGKVALVADDGGPSRELLLLDLMGAGPVAYGGAEAPRVSTPRLAACPDGRIAISDTLLVPSHLFAVLGRDGSIDTTRSEGFPAQAGSVVSVFPDGTLVAANGSAYMLFKPDKPAQSINVGRNILEMKARSDGRLHVIEGEARYYPMSGKFPDDRIYAAVRDANSGLVTQEIPMPSFVTRPGVIFGGSRLFAWENTKTSVYSYNYYPYTVTTGTAFVRAGDFPCGPDISLSPSLRDAKVGDTVVMYVMTDGTGETYAWQRDGVTLPGETGTSLAVTVDSEADTGLYSVIATNDYGTSTGFARIGFNGQFPEAPTSTPVPTATPTPAIIPLLGEAGDDVPPTLQIQGAPVRKSPRDFIVLRGKVFDETAVQRVEFARGDGPFDRCSGSARRWEKRLALNSGRNVFRMRAVDTSGNISNVERVVVIYNQATANNRGQQ